MQLEFAARLDPQLLEETVKSPLSAPAMVMLLMLTAALPLLVSVAVFAPLVWPKATVPQTMEVGDAVRVTPEALAPVPLRATVSGVGELLLVMVQVAVRLPVVVGLNRILVVQLAEAARLDPQFVLEMAKSPALAPEIPAPLSVTEADVLLVTVMDCAELEDPWLTLPKDKLAGAALTTPDPPLPSPERATSCGLLPALSAKVRFAVRVPAVVGLNKTVTVQFADAASVEPHVC